MVALGDSVDTQVYLGSAGHLHGRFLTKEKIGVFPEGLPGFDGVMVGECHDRHPKPLEPGVNFLGLVVRLAADLAKNGSVAHARCNRVNVEIAAHGTIVSLGYEQAMKRSLIVGECAHETH